MLTTKQVGRIISNWIRDKTDDDADGEILDVARVCVQSFVGWIDKEGFCISSILTRGDYESQMAKHFGPVSGQRHHSDDSTAWIDSVECVESNDGDKGEGENHES